MSIIFKNIYVFSVIYFIAVILDGTIHVQFGAGFFRYFSKSFVLGLLVFYYLANYNGPSSFKSQAVTWGLIFFIIGGCFGIYMREDMSYLVHALLFFTIGKVLYCYRMAENYDFKISTIGVFFLVFSIFMYVLINEIYQKLGDYLIMMFFYFCVSLTLLAFAFVRKDFVCLKSFLLVFFGLLLFILSESMLAVRLFGRSFPFEGAVHSLMYEIGQYLFVIGILREVVTVPKDADFTTIAKNNN